MQLRSSFLSVAIAVAALSAAGVATFSARTASATGPVSLRSLTPGQRMNLPGTTLVRFQGSSVTLQSLRDAHARHVRSFADAGSLGDAARRARELPSDAASLDIVAQADPNFTQYANDYQAFCGAAAATVCAYVPTGVSLVPDPSFGSPIASAVAFTDPYVTSAIDCRIQNGTMASDGCVFLYPSSTERTIRVATAAGVRTERVCDARNFDATASRSGHIRIRTLSLDGKGGRESNAAGCTVTFYVAHGSEQN